MGDIHYSLDMLYSVEDDIISITHPDGTIEIDPVMRVSGSKKVSTICADIISKKYGKN
jgi:hypothetical protein